MSAPRTPAQIIESLRAEVTEDGHILLDELEAELKISFWPEEVHLAAKDVFGDVVYNRSSRTYASLDRRIRHALREWDNRYGPLTQPQREYAHRLLRIAIQTGAEDAKGDRQKLYPFVQSRLGLLVNHETVDAGFKKRAELVDVGPLLAQLA